MCVNGGGVGSYYWKTGVCVVFAGFHGEDGPVGGENGVVYGESAGGDADDVVVSQRSSSEEP